MRHGSWSGSGNKYAIARESLCHQCCFALILHIAKVIFLKKKNTFHYILFNIKQNYFGILIFFAQKSKNLNCVWSFTIQLHLLMKPWFSSHHFFCPYPLHPHCLPCAAPGTISLFSTQMFQVFPQHMPLHVEFNLLASLLQSPLNSRLILLRPSWVLTPLPFGYLLI